MKIPRIPRQINTMLGMVTILRVKSVDKEDSLGECNFDLRTITLKKKLELRRAWHTLFHEQFHMLLFDSGLHNSLDPKSNVEETLCDAYATQRVSDMIAQLSQQDSKE